MSLVLNNITYKTPSSIITDGVNMFSKRSYLYETQMIFARATALNFQLPTEFQKYLIDELIRRMINEDVWNYKDIFLNFAYNDTRLNNFSRINWKNPFGNLANIIGGMTYTVQGYEANGSDGYINTGFNMVTHGVNYTATNASRSLLLYTGDATFVDGVAGANNNCIYIGAGTSASRINNGSNNLSGGVIDTSGVGYKDYSRIGNNFIFTNSTTVYNRTSTGAALDNREQYIFRRNSNYSPSGASMYSMGGASTYEQVQAFRAIYNNFLIQNGLQPIA